ncbi:MAG: tRNA preQ1(34) S-adenosylmethionine ribosyltransferase-isomerase QueA, partial [Acidobacteria bacterium]|nr:tRNA preQ1(34) S-adenosylmethionine ribosyltransferase-isomerase QueA [Acidobacteriota bacterium]
GNQIAQQPLDKREASRLLSVDRATGSFSDSLFANFPNLLKSGDLLVLNNTKVFPARLLGRAETGARIEIFLIEEIEPAIWLTLARPGKRLKAGKRIGFSDTLSGEMLERREDGRFVIGFKAAGDFDDIVEELGRTPLPPYIQRDTDGADADRDRYQTVFAKRRGAIAAPTAGLHFSGEVIERLTERGVDIAEITLHVGYGTFEPVRAADLSEHRVAPERFDINEQAAEKLERARRDGQRIVAVGTTTTRTLEYSIARNGRFMAENGRADLTITPGHAFRAVGALLTNFHLPESSLLILVATFGGHQLIMEAYRHAVSSGYRFYSYGDCMFIT